MEARNFLYLIQLGYCVTGCFTKTGPISQIIVLLMLPVEAFSVSFQVTLLLLPRFLLTLVERSSLSVYKRPFCEEFVRFCLERFDVGIWSSARRLVELHLPDLCLISLLDAINIIQKFTHFSALNMRNRTNLETALDCVIGELKGRLLFVWVGSQIRAYAMNLLCIKISFGYRFGRTEEALSLSLMYLSQLSQKTTTQVVPCCLIYVLTFQDQDDCTDSGFSTKENKNKPIFFKELKKLWDNESSNLPWRKGQYSSSNTILIDDKPYKALLNPVIARTSKSIV